jgi:hypothetical protein
MITTGLKSEAEFSENNINPGEIYREQHTGEPWREEFKLTPWGMPKEVLWDKKDGASSRRAQWVLDNCQEVKLEFLGYFFAVQDADIAKLDRNQNPSL